MRINSGAAKGRVLKSVAGRGTRPTDSRSRETIFNIVGARVINARVLDLYAGTGSLGLEALSRGAASCIFIEQNSDACRVIRENLRLLKWEEKAQVWQTNVKSALRRLGGKGEELDLLFADPPFTRESELADIAGGLDNYLQLLHNEEKRFTGLMVLQHHWKHQPPLPPGLEVVQERRTGESLLTFYQSNPNLY